MIINKKSLLVLLCLSCLVSVTNSFCCGGNWFRSSYENECFPEVSQEQKDVVERCSSKSNKSTSLLGLRRNKSFDFSELYSNGSNGKKINLIIIISSIENLALGRCESVRLLSLEKHGHKLEKFCCSSIFLFK